jgi:hypothetical protein
VKQLWRELCLEEQRCILATKASAKDAVAHILQMEKKVQLQVVLLLWLWWSERNGFVRGNESQPPATSLMSYTVMLRNS